MESKIDKYTKGNYVGFRTEDLIEARYKLNAKENDILDMVTSKLLPDKNLRYTIDLSDYKQYYDDDKHIYDDFKRTVQNISKQGLGLRSKDKKQYIYYPWFSRIKYVDNEGLIQVDFHPEMKEILLKCVEQEEIKKIFFNIKYTIKLTSEYAKRFYYYCKSFEDTEWRKDVIEILTDKMQCPKSYNSYSRLRKNVLDVAEQQINDYTDLNIKIKGIKTGRKYTHLYTTIRPKTEEELEVLNKKYLKKKDVKIKKLDGKPIRLQIEEIVKNYGDNITKENREEIAHKLQISEKSIQRYIVINKYLIDPLKELLDNGFLGVIDCYNIAKESKDKDKELSYANQKNKYNKILRESEKFKASLCPEFEELIDNFKVTYKQIEKYSKLSYEEQYSFLKRKFKIGNKKNIIDVEYKNVDSKEEKELSKITEIEEIKKELEDIVDITDEQALAIYNNSNKDIKHIKYIVSEMRKSKAEIPNPVGWVLKMVIPNAYKPVVVKNEFTNRKSDNAKVGFNNFTPREYDYDSLEKKLLGWDKEDESQEDEPKIEVELKVKRMFIQLLEMQIGKENVDDLIKGCINDMYIKNNKLICPVDNINNKIKVINNYLKSFDNVLSIMKISASISEDIIGIDIISE